MVTFRCWKCRRKYKKADEKIGTRFLCSCDYELRVPKQDYGNCRIRTIADRLIEAVLCGGGCALFGFIIGFVLLNRSLIYTWPILLGISGLFGVVGLIGGEYALELIGNWLREQGPD